MLYYFIVTNTLAEKLEVFTKDDKIQRGVRTKVAIPKNQFVAEYEANVLTEDEARAQEERYSKEGEDLYIMQASYNGTKVVFDATYRTNSMGRLINHSRKHANILLRKPIEIRSKLRIGFIAKRDIKANEELLFDYDLKSYCSSELPEWYLEKSEDPTMTTTVTTTTTTTTTTMIHKRFRKCQVPGCGVTVQKVWNHIHGTSHKSLSGKMACVWSLNVFHQAVSSSELEKAKYVKLSLKAVVEDGEHKGRRVTTSCRGLPMHKLDQPWLLELKQ